ncbi:bifunctional metallophosphatase/5'-nucleotidase [Roseofilum casamattae]|uniref:5'-nucleotidase C-terminal domain-containing protein n=1 Tax=Roseofilum casamattae BLCC-M143 TaxID=3022442 RepID=A0ABT7BYI7_9CYAN|nr:5'-nucleotidase C-terminal domain-containing protein [Roseofilum casamattae]MDJ1183847.1 5'-nucleotidase C-terminal domain-containing protein [Roseofilum casamattae BLCC-M143]
MNRLNPWLKITTPFIVGLLLALLYSWWSDASIASSSFELRLLHTNDHHAHLEPVKAGDKGTLGGIAQRKTLIDRLRQESEANHQPLLLLDAGDVFQGTLYFNTYQGQADLEFYNRLDYDAMTVGNHEFDRGQEPLAEFIQGADFPVLSANLDVNSSSPLFGLTKPWIILERDREKIGIIGLTTDRTPELSNVGEGIVFQDPIVTARKSVAELSKQGINKIVALTHLGIAQDLQLAQQVDGIDVILGGHSHTKLGEIPGAENPYPIVRKTPNGDPILVATDWEWGKYLGDLQVEFDRQGKLTQWNGNLHAIDETIPADPEFETILQDLRQPIQAMKAEMIGETSVRLNGDRDEIRRKATNLGTLIAEAMLSKTKGSGAQVAITNGGGIRASIARGPIAFGQVLEVLPFGNTIIQIELTGEQIAETLEYGVSQIEHGGGCFPQVAGLQFSWDATLPVGSRVTNIKMRQPDGAYVPLNNRETYRVVTTKFLYKGGDGYSGFQQGQNKLDTGYLLSDSLIEYIRAHSPIR